MADVRGSDDSSERGSDDSSEHGSEPRSEPWTARDLFPQFDLSPQRAHGFTCCLPAAVLEPVKRALLAAQEWMGCGAWRSATPYLQEDVVDDVDKEAQPTAGPADRPHPGAWVPRQPPPHCADRASAAVNAVRPVGRSGHAAEGAELLHWDPSWNTDWSTMRPAAHGSRRGPPPTARARSGPSFAKVAKSAS